MPELKYTLIEIADRALNEFVRVSGREPKKNVEEEKDLNVWMMARKYPPAWVRNYYDHKNK